MNRAGHIALILILLIPIWQGCSRRILPDTLKGNQPSVTVAPHDTKVEFKSERRSDSANYQDSTNTTHSSTVLLDSIISNSNQSLASDTSNLFFGGLPTDSLNTIISPGESEHSDSTLTLNTEASDSLSKAKERQVIDAPIEYNSADSLAFTLDERGQMAHLFGEAKITYGEIELTAGYIQIDFKNKEIMAKGITDSTGTISQKPHFKQGTEEFDCQSLRYNFETGRGFVENIVTKQQDGIVHSERGKMLSKEVFCLADGKFTVCDAEHPHFYLYISKGKVLGNQAIIAGRSYLVLEDFPIYFPFLPYGYIPTANKTYSSGIIIPSYGEEAQYGFFLKDGGFYWAASDYFDFTIKGDIYSKGSWALKTTSNYRLRYKFSGSLGISTSRHITGIKGIDEKISKNFAINWTHSQDAKANPNRTISASVNFSTSGYDRLNEYTDYNKSISNTKSSNISYQRTFPNTPFKLSMNIRATQSSSDTTVSLELPTFTLNMKTIEPFKKKNRVGNKKFWEDISLSYSTDFRNTVKLKEYELLTTSLSQWQKGIKHNIGIGLPSFKILKQINVSPSFSYGQTWHFNYINRYWVDGYQTVDEENVKQWVPGHVEEIQKDGFKMTYFYNYGFSTNTTLYGLFQMKNSNSKIKGIRHKMNPSLGFSINPDFRKERYGFYDWVQTDSLGTTRQYSHFEKTAYPYSAGGRSGSITFGLKNNIEMKVVDNKDTTSTEATKKIPIFEDLSFNGSYNLFADSMNLSIISWNMRTKLAGFTLNINGTLDPYSLDERGNRINKYMWSTGKGLNRLGRLTSASTGFSYSFSSDKIKKKMGELQKGQGSSPSGGGPPGPDQGPGQNEGPDPENGPNNSGYQSFSMPWSINFSYSLSYSHTGLKPQVNQNLTFSGNIDVTSKWKANFNSSFNFKTMRMNALNMGISRSLHCWNMAFQFSPFGSIKFYTFTLNANSSLLKDLKIDKSSGQY